MKERKSQDKKLECAMNECLQRTKELQENTDKRFAAVESKMKPAKEEPKLTSCLQEKLPMFTAREDEIQTIISSLQNEKTGGRVSSWWTGIW